MNKVIIIPTFGWCFVGREDEGNRQESPVGRCPIGILLEEESCGSPQNNISIVVSFKNGHKQVQRAWSEKLAGPWTFEPEVIIPPGAGWRARRRNHGND